MSCLYGCKCEACIKTAKVLEVMDKLEKEDCDVISNLLSDYLKYKELFERTGIEISTLYNESKCTCDKCTGVKVKDYYKEEKSCLNQTK